MPERGVVLGRLEDLLVGDHAQRVLDQLLVGALGPLGRVLEQQHALAELAREVVLPGLELAAQLVAPGGEDVGPGLDRPLPAARAVDDERAAPADAVDVGVERVQLGLAPLALARGPVQHDRAELLVAVAEHVGRDLDEVADGPLGRVPARIDDRLRVLDMDPRRRRRWAVPFRHRCGSIRGKSRTHSTVGRSATSATVHGRGSPALLRRAAPSDVAAGRPARARRVRVGRLARRRRPVVVADAAARPAGPLRVAVQGPLGVRGVARPAGRAGRAGLARPRSSTSASARRAGSRTGRASPGRGAVADQVRFEREWSALRAYANERGVRLIGDVPIYVAPGSADHRARPELFRDDAVAGTPPDAYTDKGQLWGNPLYDWPALQRRGYRWWIDAARAHVRALRPRADRPLPRLRLLLGGAERRPPRARRRLAARARARAVRPRAARRSARCRSSPRTSASSRRRSSGCATRSGCPGWSCSSSAGCRARRDNVHDVANHREHRIAYTGTHDNDTLRGWYESLPDATRAQVDATRPHADGRGLVGPDRADVLVAGAGRDGAGAGRARDSGARRG